MLKQLLRTKPVVHDLVSDQLRSLHRCLKASDLVLLGIGAIIGAGLFVLTGIAAATQAGPGITLSYIVAGVVCAFTALCYAELAASVGGAGSAYGYAYAGLGEFLAWFIGWNLILEYGLSAATIAVGWASYVNNVLESIGAPISRSLLTDPFSGGIINLPAMLIIAVLAILLCMGTKQSAKFNAAIVFIKLLAIAIFVSIAVFHLQPHYWTPFLPFGFKGVMGGAAFILFSYIGFDAVSTAAEESVNPQRDLPIGIIVSLVVCTLLYALVAACLTGIVSYTTLNVGSPVSQALLSLKLNFGAAIVAAGAIAGLTTTMLVMYYGLTRVFYAISKDGLLPGFFSRVNSKTHTPIPVIICSGIIIMLAAGLIPIDALAEIVNIGTLAAFVTVCIGVIILRIRQPKLARPFKVPFYPITPLLGGLFCFYLMVHLHAVTWWRFLAWTLLGTLIYFFYGLRHSRLAKISQEQKS
ncbi:MAG: amino acid permease [Gammaproteobacteria bacterium]|nr:amino acid permease [Gammaproteobacteria bacterium]